MAETIVIRLLAVQGPLQYVAGAIAMNWFSKRAPVGIRYRSILLMYDFMMPSALEPEFAEVIAAISAGANWDHTVFIGTAQIDSMARGVYSHGIEVLKLAIGEPHIDEVYLARDYVGHGSALIANAYDNATKIMYGDSLGLIANRQDFTHINWSSPVRACARIVRHGLRKLLLGGARAVHFDYLVLSLPLDLSRGEMDAVPLLVPSKAHVQQEFASICGTVESLQSYARTLVAGISGRTHLVLLSNLSASGLMSEAKEIALYVSIIECSATADDLVLLKIHPRSGSQVLEAVFSQLADSYNVKVIDDASLLRVPVELWSDLIVASNVIAIFSTSALNIKYLYDQDVVLPLNAALIADYFYPDKVAYVSEACRMIEESIEALDTWDGNSILWRKYS